MIVREAFATFVVVLIIFVMIADYPGREKTPYVPTTQHEEMRNGQR